MNTFKHNLLSFCTDSDVISYYEINDDIGYDYVDVDSLDSDTQNECCMKSCGDNLTYETILR